MKIKNKWLIGGALASTLALGSIALADVKSPLKVMRMKFNDHVNIYITNVDCPDKTARADGYLWYAVAMRADGDKLRGCFNGKANQITIQWLGGDKSYLSTDAFVPVPIETDEDIKATL